MPRWVVARPDTVCNMAITGQAFEIRAGQYRASISEVGAGLAGLWFGDRPITSPWPDGVLPPMSSGAVLLPWPNRIADGKYSFGPSDFQLPLTEPAQHNASHGLTRWVRWDLAGQDTDHVTVSHDLVPQTGYPFELKFEIRYTVSAESGLTVGLRAQNHGAATAPFGAGFHPYLDLDGHDIADAEIEVPASTMLLTNDHQIPTERQPVAGTPYQLSPLRRVGDLQVDHGFTDLTGSQATIKAGGNVTELWWSEEFKYVQVFRPPVERFKRTAIAIEPMTCPANAFNSGAGLIELSPGQSWSAEWGIRAAVGQPSAL